MKEYRCNTCEKGFNSKESLEMHNQAKHSEDHKAPFLSSAQKKKIRNYGIALLLILAVVAFFYWRSIPLKDAPIIEITPKMHDFNFVSQAKGMVNTTMTINNLGTQDLIINGMDTSCGCTSAAIVSNGIEGPQFSMTMHGTNPENWEQIIPPGESVQLRIYYDPNVHAKMRGAVARSVYIFSNDPRNKKMEVGIRANQVD